jgi:hypothetical protein
MPQQRRTVQESEGGSRTTNTHAGENRFTPPVKKPIAGWRALLGCLLLWSIGGVAAAELVLYARGASGSPGTTPAMTLLIRQYGPLFELARLWEYGLVILVATVLVAVGRKRLRIEHYGRPVGRLLVFSCDFLLCLAATAGALDALGGAALVLLGANPFQSYVFLAAGAAAAAFLAALLLNVIRTGRFLTNLYQISMM